MAPDRERELGKGKQGSADRAPGVRGSSMKAPWAIGAPCRAPGGRRPNPPDKGMTERQPASRLEALLRARQFAITAEITPPVSCEADDLLRKALPLAGLADAVNVTAAAGPPPHLSAPPPPSPLPP